MIHIQLIAATGFTMRMSNLVPTHHKLEAAVRNTNPENFHRSGNQLWFSFKPRINLSPFTKDFRGGEQQNESID